jgi:hypothetical protein
MLQSHKSVQSHMHAILHVMMKERQFVTGYRSRCVVFMLHALNAGSNDLAAPS